MKNRKKSWLYYILSILFVLFGGTGAVGSITGTETVPAQQTSIVVEEQIPSESQTVQEEQYVQEITYRFRNEKLLKEHYEKHGVEMGFDSIESYVSAANEIIKHPDTLHKIEKEDGDDVYDLEENNGFVVVSVDGYIRTFFYPSDGLDYFNRQ